MSPAAKDEAREAGDAGGGALARVLRRTRPARGTLARFPPEIPRRARIVWGVAGVLSVLLVWWFLTLPMLTQTRVERTQVPTGATEVLPDPVTGEPVEVERYETRTRRVVEARAIVEPPALETPLATLRRAWELLTERDPNLLEHIGWSTLRILAGFLVSSAIAVPLGVTLGLFPRLRAFSSPLVSFVRPLPSIAWVPLAMIWLGLGETQKVAIVFMGSFAAALVYTVEATVRVDPDLIRAARNLGATRGQLLFRVLLPAALPSIVSGLKVVLAIGWTCVISAEIVGTQEGLGALVWTSKESADTRTVLVGMACISGVVLVLDALSGGVERLVVPWTYRGRGR